MDLEAKNSPLLDMLEDFRKKKPVSYDRIERILDRIDQEKAGNIGIFYLDSFVKRLSQEITDERYKRTLTRRGFYALTQVLADIFPLVKRKISTMDETRQTGREMEILLGQRLLQIPFAEAYDIHGSALIDNRVTNWRTYNMGNSSDGFVIKNYLRVTQWVIVHSTYADNSCAGNTLWDVGALLRDFRDKGYNVPSQREFLEKMINALQDPLPELNERQELLVVFPHTVDPEYLTHVPEPVLPELSDQEVIDTLLQKTGLTQKALCDTLMRYGKGEMTMADDAVVKGFSRAFPSALLSQSSRDELQGHLKNYYPAEFNSEENVLEILAEFYRPWMALEKRMRGE